MESLAAFRILKFNLKTTDGNTENKLTVCLSTWRVYSIAFRSVASNVAALQEQEQNRLRRTDAEEAALYFLNFWGCPHPTFQFDAQLLSLLSPQWDWPALILSRVQSFLAEEYHHGYAYSAASPMSSLTKLDFRSLTGRNAPTAWRIVSFYIPFPKKKNKKRNQKKKKNKQTPCVCFMIVFITIVGSN